MSRQIDLDINKALNKFGRMIRSYAKENPFSALNTVEECIKIIIKYTEQE